MQKLLTAVGLQRKTNCKEAEGCKLEFDVLISGCTLGHNIQSLRYLGEVHSVVCVEKASCEDRGHRSVYGVESSRGLNPVDIPIQYQ